MKKEKIDWSSKTLVGKPKVKLPKYSAKKALLKGRNFNEKLVGEGRTGYFDAEMVEETKWLG